MRCQDVQEQLLLCRDEVDLLTRPDLIEHLEVCAGCRLSFEEAQSLNDLLDSLPVDLPTDGFSRRVMAAVELAGEPTLYREPPTGRPPAENRSWRRRWLPTGAARFADWALAMTATFVVFTMGWSLLLDSRVTALANAGPEVAFALTDWWPRIGFTLVGYANRLVSLFGAS